MFVSCTRTQVVFTNDLNHPRVSIQSYIGQFLSWEDHHALNLSLADRVGKTEKSAQRTVSANPSPPSILLKLNSELVLNALCFLNVGDLNSLSRVNRQWHRDTWSLIDRYPSSKILHLIRKIFSKQYYMAQITAIALRAFENPREAPTNHMERVPECMAQLYKTQTSALYNLSRELQPLDLNQNDFSQLKAKLIDVLSEETSPAFLEQGFKPINGCHVLYDVQELSQMPLPDSWKDVWNLSLEQYFIKFIDRMAAPHDISSRHKDYAFQRVVERCLKFHFHNLAQVANSQIQDQEAFRYALILRLLAVDDYETALIYIRSLEGERKGIAFGELISQFLQREGQSQAIRFAESLPTKECQTMLFAITNAAFDPNFPEIAVALLAEISPFNRWIAILCIIEKLKSRGSDNSVPLSLRLASLLPNQEATLNQAYGDIISMLLSDQDWEKALQYMKFIHNPYSRQGFEDQINIIKEQIEKVLIKFNADNIAVDNIILLIKDLKFELRDKVLKSIIPRCLDRLGLQFVLSLYHKASNHKGHILDVAIEQLIQKKGVDFTIKFVFLQKDDKNFQIKSIKTIIRYLTRMDIENKERLDKAMRLLDWLKKIEGRTPQDMIGAFYLIIRSLVRLHDYRKAAQLFSDSVLEESIKAEQAQPSHNEQEFFDSFLSFKNWVSKQTQ